MNHLPVLAWITLDDGKLRLSRIAIHNSRRSVTTSNAQALMSKKLIRIMVPVAGFLAIIFTTGCETTEGFGRDVESAGESIEDTARDVRN